MSYIITDDKHYKNIANAIRSKLLVDTQYQPEDMSIAINNIPSAADGTDNPVFGIYLTNPDDGYPTKAKIVGWRLDNKETAFPIAFTDLKFRRLQTIEFLDCEFKSLPGNAFSGCSSLTSVHLPNTLTSISNNAFQGCSSLTSINLPNTLTSINGYAFQDCLSLTSINLPNILMKMDVYVFRNCPNLTSINLPNTLTSINRGVFLNCPNLVDVTLANGFNCNNLDLSSSTKFTRETIVSWLIALADRTGLTAYKLIMGATNIAKLTEEDIAIATAKNWTLA